MTTLLKSFKENTLAKFILLAARIGVKLKEKQFGVQNSTRGQNNMVYQYEEKVWV